MDINNLLTLNNINTIRNIEISSLLNSSKILLVKSDDGRNLSEQVFDLMMDTVIRRGDGLIFREVQDLYKDKITNYINNKKPIHFVFQGFPFKCHNPVETLRRTPDLGEVAYLTRLKSINETVKQIYPPGIRFTAITEGKTYASLFGATSNEVNSYMESIKGFSKLLSMENVISFTDFLDIVDEDKFLENCKKEEDTIFDRITKFGFNSELEQLAGVMKRSLPITESVSFEDLLTVFGFVKNKASFTEFQFEFSKYIHEASKELTAKYLAIQSVKKRFEIIKNNFPDALYVSTVSRNDLYSFHPIHKKTRLFPHHGVPVLGSDKIDIVYFGEIITNPDVYTAVYISDDLEDAPFYYLKGKQHLRK